MEVVHSRCAGIDVSKRDAKVCIRIQGEGGRRTSSTVTSWGAMTNQVLALRDHLAGHQVTVVVMEATGDSWRPFYYVLEADFRSCWSTRAVCGTSPAERRMSPMPSGLPTWVHTAWSGPRSYHRNRSARCGT